MLAVFLVEVGVTAPSLGPDFEEIVETYFYGALVDGRERVIDDDIALVVEMENAIRRMHIVFLVVGMAS